MTQVQQAGAGPYGGRQVMSSATIAVALTIASASVAADTNKAPTFVAHAKDIVSMSPAADTSEQALADQWGQFELRVKKPAFPIAAPNCKSDIILRVPATAPNSKHGQEKLAARWKLFQEVVKLQSEPNAEPVSIPLSLRYYVNRSSKGELALQYCNAYVDLPM
jgi:hypothetical protein